MQIMSRTVLVSVLVLAIAIPAVAAEYLFESNIKQYEEIGKVESRSYKFLAGFEPGKDMKTSILQLRDLVLKAGESKGYKYAERKKGDEWRLSEKRYLDTPERDLYKKGYVIRETYRFKEGESPDLDKFVLTVKEMSPSDFKRLAASRLGPVPGSDALVKFEENVSIDDAGRLQSYFESAVGARADSRMPGARTLGDYGKLYPELLNMGLPASIPLVPVTAYSLQLKFGYFELPDGDKAKMDIEMWSRTADGSATCVAEIAFETDNDNGYANPAGAMRAAEDFFLKVFAEGLKEHAMPAAGQYMGSKVRVLFEQKYEKSEISSQ